jgi:hypothetical protein
MSPNSFHIPLHNSSFCQNSTLQQPDAGYTCGLTHFPYLIIMINEGLCTANAHIASQRAALLLKYVASRIADGKEQALAHVRALLETLEPSEIQELQIGILTVRERIELNSNLTEEQMTKQMKQIHIALSQLFFEFGHVLFAPQPTPICDTVRQQKRLDPRPSNGHPEKAPAPIIKFDIASMAI